MRRVFVRELMSGQSARFRANAIIPPQLGADDVDSIDADNARTPLSTPPLGSMEYSLFGYPQGKNSGEQSVFGYPQGKDGMSPQQPSFGGRRSPLGFGKGLGRELDTASLEPGMHYSPLGGLVDVASEDDRDSRHSVPIRNMGEYGAAMHRVRAAEARDPLLDERTAQMQRKNMFGNPYRRPLREPRGPANNVLARNPELSAKLGLSRSSSRTPSLAPPPRAEADEDTALEMESEAEVNELAVDKIFEDLPPSEGGEGEGRNGEKNNGKFSWMQRRNVPRRRSIAAPWRKNDRSWNVNPWNMPPDSPRAAEPGALTYTADAVIVNKNTAQIIRAANGSTPAASATSPRTGNVSGIADSHDSEPLAAGSHPSLLPGLGIVAGEAGSQGPPPPLLSEQMCEDAISEDTPLATTPDAGVGDSSAMDIDTPIPKLAPAPTPTAASILLPAPAPTPTPDVVPVPALTLEVASAPAPVPAGRKVNVSEERAWFLRRIKADPAHYDEEGVVQRLAELQSNPLLGKPQLKVIVMAAIAAAKAMRRKQLVARLEQGAKASL
ncbi:hypothetical protein IWW50_005688 [Coemansia erecta]|nr:hypothetical protein IWW50_005688 [Coemansia erecta]